MIMQQYRKMTIRQQVHKTMTVSEKLQKLLFSQEKYQADSATDGVEGKKVLNKTLVSADARAYDTELLTLLQSDEAVKSHFFVQVKKTTIFKLEHFLTFVNNESFLPDSFTAFKNKIGLATDKDHYLSDGKEVVLNWAYKDCVLEGGQTKEDQERDEVFFNEILAPDQINRLLDDKVFTNWKRYDKTGEHKVTELKPTDNLIIKGNNLVVLHSLKRRFGGKIKLIYIDPPYNTGSDSFRYNDRFNHSTWLTFMKNRLEVALDLLSDDGFLVVQIDDYEQAYLKVLLDSITHKDLFVNTIVWVKTTSGKTVSEQLAENIDYLHVYRKSDSAKVNPVFQPLSEQTISMYNKDDNDGRGKYRLYPLQKTDSPGPETSYNYVDNSGKVWKMPKKGWRIVESKLRELDNDNRLYFNGTSLNEKAYWNERANGDGKIASSLWNDLPENSVAKTELEKLFRYIPFDTPKPEKLIERIIKLSTKEGDIVLDFHLGSGTTAAVAHKTRRQYIGVEQMDYVETVSAERIKKVIAGEQGGISKSVNWQGGGSFVYCELANDAEDFRKVVKKAKASELPELLEKVGKSSFLSWRVEPEKFNGFENLSESEQRALLLQLVDCNTLYVNYTEIEDEDYRISKQDRELNRQFYGG